MISFCLYEENDCVDLLEMIKSLYQEDPEGEPMDEEKARRTVAEFRNHPEKLSIYMFRAGKVNIGYAILVYFWSNEYGGNIVTIDELYVKDSYRNQGVGTKFLSFAEAMEDKAALQLEATPSNRRALDFYRRFGFVSSKNTHFMLINNK